MKWSESEDLELVLHHHTSSCHCFQAIPLPCLQRFRVHEDSVVSETCILWNSASCSFLGPVFTSCLIGPVHSTLFSGTLVSWDDVVLCCWDMGDLLLDCLILDARGRNCLLNLHSHIPATVWGQVLHKCNVYNAYFSKCIKLYVLMLCHFQSML